MKEKEKTQKTVEIEQPLKLQQSLVAMVAMDLFENTTTKWFKKFQEQKKDCNGKRERMRA